MPIVDKLITIIGLKSDGSVKKVSEGFEKSLSSVKKIAIGLSATLGAMRLADFTNNIIKSTDASGKFAKQVNVSFQQLQELDFATQSLGGSSQDLRNDILKLTEDMASPIPGEFNQILEVLGISVKKANGHFKNARDIILELSDRIKGFSAQRQVQILSKLGISESTIKLIQSGRKSIIALSKQAESLGGIIPSDATKKAADFDNQMLNVHFAIKGMAATIASEFIPNITDSIKGFSKFIARNKELISLNIKDVIKGISDGFENFALIIRAVTSPIFKFINALSGSKKGLTDVKLIALTVTAALIGLTAPIVLTASKFALIGAALSPIIALAKDFLSSSENIKVTIIALTTALTGLAVVLALVTKRLRLIAIGFTAGIAIIQDFITFLKGGKSVTGEVVSFIEKEFKNLSNFFKNIPLLSYLKDIENGFSDIEKKISNLNPFQYIQKNANSLRKTLGNIGDSVKSFFKEKNDNLKNINVTKKTKNIDEIKLKSIVSKVPTLKNNIDKNRNLRLMNQMSNTKNVHSFVRNISNKFSKNINNNQKNIKSSNKVNNIKNISTIKNIKNKIIPKNITAQSMKIPVSPTINNQFVNSNTNSIKAAPINITQNISGNNSSNIANKVIQKAGLGRILQKSSPGFIAPVVK